MGETLRSGHIPEPWKRAATILIHKKDSTDNPDKFHPITIECVPLKIFTSLLRDGISIFIHQNGYIESHIQKVFVHVR